MSKTIFCEQLFSDFSEYFEEHLDKVGLEKDMVKEPGYEIPERAFVELFENVGEKVYLENFPYYFRVVCCSLL